MIERSSGAAQKLFRAATGSDRRGEQDDAQALLAAAERVGFLLGDVEDVVAVGEGEHFDVTGGGEGGFLLEGDLGHNLFSEQRQVAVGARGDEAAIGGDDQSQERAQVADDVADHVLGGEAGTWRTGRYSSASGAALS